MDRTILSLFLAGFWLAAAPVHAETARTAQAILKQATTYGTDQPNMQGYGQEAVFVLGTGDNYGVDYRGGTDTSDPKKPFTPGKGQFCMGMPGPVATGWYCYGFLNFTLNGQEASTTKPGSVMVSENGRRAMVDSVWSMDAADVRVRFLGLPGRDFLFCEMTVDPRQEVKSLDLTMMCYPAYFTGFYGQREQARYVQTPAELIREAEGRKNIRLEPKNNWWLIYGDDNFDVAKTKESEGPCAMLILPEDVVSIAIRGLGYDVTTTVSIGPQTRRIRMAFWKMKGRTNAEAIAYFLKNGEALRKELAALDFMPETVRVMDMSGITADVERIARSEVVGSDFRKKATDLLAWIKESAADLAAGRDSIGPTERKLQLLVKYAGIVNEARLAEILAAIGK